MSEKLLHVQDGFAWQTAIPLRVEQFKVTTWPPQVPPEPSDTEFKAHPAGHVQLPFNGQGLVQVPSAYEAISPFVTHLLFDHRQSGVYPHSKAFVIAVHALVEPPAGIEVGAGDVDGLVQSRVSCATPFTQVFQQAPCLQNEL